jgi:RES domain-containing protein
MLERLVHVVRQAGLSARNYTLLEIEAGDGIAIESLLDTAEVAWRDRIDLTQAAGDRWLADRKTPLVRVPSAVVPRTWNYMLNPLHPYAQRVRIISQLDEIFDARLFQSRHR